MINECRSPQALLSELRAEVAQRSAGSQRTPANPGESARIERYLSQILNPAQRTVFLGQVFGLLRASEMSRAQFYVLRDWLQEPGLIHSRHIAPQARQELTAWLNANSIDK